MAAIDRLAEKRTANKGAAHSCVESVHRVRFNKALEEMMPWV